MKFTTIKFQCHNQSFKLVVIFNIKENWTVQFYI